jgi:serine/threonine-protein kinase
MGVVLSATHLELGQKVAIKVLTIPDDDTRKDEARERFLREGRATAALVSDHVVRVYDVGTLDNGAPFMVMELLRGRDLAVTLQHNGALPIEHAADYVRQAADAIACAHDQGIVHRDLKPSNLFLTQRSDGTPLVKVLDFGISKTTQSELDRATSNLTVARSVLGTPFYMSPEQIRDAKQVDFRTDIWSLGLILHELLSGSPAFEGTTLPGVCAAIAADPPAALRLKRPEIPVELEAIVLKCLEKDPAKRFQDTRDLAAKLVRYCGRAEISSPAPLPERSIHSTSLTVNISALRNNETVVQKVVIDPSTMQSAQLTGSGERAVPLTPLTTKDGHALSAPPASDSAGARRGAASSAPLRSLWLVGAGLIALLGLGAWALRGAGSALPVAATSSSALTPEVPPKPPASSTFSLEIAASEAGAQVFEGERPLGATPLRLTLDNASLLVAPRTFTVRKSGYAPYTIVQGPAQADLHVLAELALEPAAASAALHSPKTKKAPPPKAATADKPKSANPPSDIFMQR